MGILTSLMRRRTPSSLGIAARLGYPAQVQTCGRTAPGALSSHHTLHSTTDKYIFNIYCTLSISHAPQPTDVRRFYPADVNLQLTWHGDVKPGALIRREHDVFMLNRWVAT
jgi:hypothetical protein